MIATGSKPMQLRSFSMYFVLCLSVLSDENDIRAIYTRKNKTRLT